MCVVRVCVRVMCAVAIAIVAETCSPFTVLPALYNEYRVPELNVQNGVLKALSFLFEYIGEMGKDYVYATLPLLEDALMDRDMVHRQTACTVVKRKSSHLTRVTQLFMNQTHTPHSDVNRHVFGCGRFGS